MHTFLLLFVVVPWDFHPELLHRGPSKLRVAVFVLVGTLVGLAVGFIFAMNCSRSFNKSVQEKVFLNHPALVQNRVLRRSLALPMNMSDDEQDSDESIAHEETKLLKN